MIVCVFETVKQRLWSMLLRLRALFFLSVLFSVSAFGEQKTESVPLEPIILATINWEPFYGEELLDEGYFAVISKEAFRLAGYDLKTEYVSWKRAVAGTYKGLYDGLLGSFYDEQRAEYVVYSEPVATTEQVFIKSRVSPVTYAGEDDLRLLRIAAYTDSITLSQLRTKGYAVEPIPEYKLAIKMLLADRFDVFGMSKEHLTWLLINDPKMQPYRHRIEILQPAYTIFEVHNVITKERDDAAEVINAFDQGLLQLKLSGKYDQIMAKFGQD